MPPHTTTAGINAHHDPSISGVARMKMMPPVYIGCRTSA